MLYAGCSGSLLFASLYTSLEKSLLTLVFCSIFKLYMQNCHLEIETLDQVTLKGAMLQKVFLRAVYCIPEDLGCLLLICEYLTVGDRYISLSLLQNAYSRVQKKRGSGKNRVGGNFPTFPQGRWKFS